MRVGKDRQGFVELCELVYPMQSVYKEIAKTGRGLHTKLKTGRGKKMHALCKNIQGKMIAHGKIQVDAEGPELRPLKTYDKDICQALNNRRKCMERLRSTRIGPQMSRSIASLANMALAHREELRQQGRWQPFLKGQDLRHIPPAQDQDNQDQVMGEELPEEQDTNS